MTIRHNAGTIYYPFDWRPGVRVSDDVLPHKFCRRCKVGFTTRSRNKIRCDACRELARTEQQDKSEAKRRARRKAGMR
jgi:hypothetical protein